MLKFVDGTIRKLDTIDVEMFCWFSSFLPKKVANKHI